MMKRYVSLLVIASTIVLTAAFAAYEYEGYFGSFGKGDGLFFYPSGVTAEAGYEGNFYVADTNNHRIQYFQVSSTGSTASFVREWGSFGSEKRQFNYPSGIALAGDIGYVYVADRSNHRIQYFDKNGSFLGMWGSYGSTKGLFKNPCGVAVTADGYVYVADTSNDRIQYFTANGSFLGQWGKAGAGNGEFRDPRGVAAASSARIYVADTGNNRIQYFTRRGSFIGAWGRLGSPPSGFDFPAGVACSPDNIGHVFVADTKNDVVQQFDGVGSFIGSWGRTGTAVSSFNYPLGIAVAGWYKYPGHRVFVADAHNNRIQWFKRDEIAVTPASLGRVKALFR
ncbi:MAG TPA: 6-bladed beta-propeller [bacterium]|nr:6-bladed beta-propeller [bacterium]